MPFVRTDDNIADFFTKPLPPKKFAAMRRVIMNEDADPTLSSDCLTVGRRRLSPCSTRPSSEGGRRRAEPLRLRP